MASLSSFHSLHRQIDKYDGQSIFICNRIVYELENWLGAGASGSVYHGIETATQKTVAIKILNPIGYKLFPAPQISQCIIISKGLALSKEQAMGKSPLLASNVWWLLYTSTKQMIAAYEDPNRHQLRELTLPKCVEVWGWSPLGADKLQYEDVEKKNIDKANSDVPIVSSKYLKWLYSRQAICKEMNSMVQVGHEHPNIIDLVEVLELIQDSKATLFLVLEYVNGGELFERMKMCNHGTSEEFAKQYFTQLLSGIDYCHQKGVVHRDLKPENLLLSDSSENALLKIADFGLSAVVFAAESIGSGIGSSPSLDTLLSISLQDLDVNDNSSSNSNNSNNNNINNNSNQQGNNYHSNNNNKHHHQYPSHSNNGEGSPSNGKANRARQQAVQLTPPSSLLSSPSDKSPLDKPALRRLRSVVGSPHYVAPEVISHDQSGYDGSKVDMWSAGIILYALLTGQHPFGSDIALCPQFQKYKKWVATDYTVAVKEGRQPLYPTWFFPPRVSASAASLIVLLLHYDPSQRITAAEAQMHAWFHSSSAIELKAMSLSSTSANTKFNEQHQHQQHTQQGSSSPTAATSVSRTVTRQRTNNQGVSVIFNIIEDSQTPAAFIAESATHLAHSLHSNDSP